MTPIMETLYFIKMRMEGVEFDAKIEEVVEEKEKELHEIIDDLSQKLLNKKAEVNQVEKELMTEVFDVKVFEAAEFQKKNLEETIQALEPSIIKMNDKLDNSTLKLAEMQRQTMLLENELKGLTMQLKQAKGKNYFFQDPLNQFMEKIPSYKRKNSI